MKGPSQSGEEPSFPRPPITTGGGRCAERERSASRSGKAGLGSVKHPSLDDLTQTITAYTTVTKNPCFRRTPCPIHIGSIEKLKTVIQTMFEMAECRIHSFAAIS